MHKLNETKLDKIELWYRSNNKFPLCIMLQRMPSLGEVVKPLTAGIISYQVKNSNSNMMLYDLAGHHSYYSSHCSLLETISLTSPSTFLMLVDVTTDLDGITAQMYYWSAMIGNVCHKCLKPSSVIMVGTHADKVGKDYLTELGKEIMKLARDIFQQQIFEQFIGLNVTGCGDDQKIFFCLLDRVNENVRQRSPAISLNSHMMYAFLNDKVHPGNEAISLSSLISILDKEEPHVLPTKKSEIIALLTTLAEKGFIVFLSTVDGDSWIVLDQGTLLEKVNGALFAPSFFKEHLSIASNTGIIPINDIKKCFHNHNPSMIVEFLIQLQLCQHISLYHVSTNMAPKMPSSSDHFFFPALIDTDRPCFDQGTKFTTPDRCFGWLLSTDSIHQFFPNRFFHSLLLKLAHTLCLPVKSHKTNIKIKNCQCKVWRCGISWNSVKGVSAFIELMEQSRCLFLVMSFPDPKFHNELVPVLKTINEAFSQYCPSLETTAYIVDPSKASSVFTRGCSLPSLTRIELSHLRDALDNDDPTVVDTNNEVVFLKNWTSVEPYISCLVSIALNGKVLVPIRCLLFTYLLCLHRC